MATLQVHLLSILTNSKEESTEIISKYNSIYVAVIIYKF